RKKMSESGGGRGKEPGPLPPTNSETAVPGFPAVTDGLPSPSGTGTTVWPKSFDDGRTWRAKTNEGAETDQGCPEPYRQQPDSPGKTELEQVPDRWKRSSEPTQCIGKTPVAT